MSRFRHSAPASEPRRPPRDVPETWVLWNGSLGLAVEVTLGRVDDHTDGRVAWLAQPFEMAGPFSLDALETEGRVTFAACVVMSLERWRKEREDLLLELHRKRRAEAEQQRRFREAAGRGSRPWRVGDERVHREVLRLPVEGPLATAQIKAAFRKLARAAHPDTGGSHEHFIRLTKARDALLTGSR